VVSSKPLQLYPRGKSPRYPLDRILRGPQSRCGCCGEENNLLPLHGIEARFLRCPASSPSLYRLCYPGYLFTSIYLLFNDAFIYKITQHLIISLVNNEQERYRKRGCGIICSIMSTLAWNNMRTSQKSRSELRFETETSRIRSWTTNH
jgi:hypothetical protein